MKVCTSCKEEKELSEFYNSKFYPDGRGYRCKVCDNIAGRAYKEKHKDRQRGLNRARSLRYKYKLEISDYNEILEKQNHVCALCHKEPIKTHVHGRLVVDHDHVTGRVRGLLCHKCNQALGLFKDSIETLKRAVKYLKENNG